jgi:hypothetical protein
VKIHVMAHNRRLSPAKDTRVVGVALLLLGVVMLLPAGLLRDGDTLVGVAILLTGVGMLLFGVAKLRNQHQG